MGLVVPCVLVYEKWGGGGVVGKGVKKGVVWG